MLLTPAYTRLSRESEKQLFRGRASPTKLNLALMALEILPSSFLTGVSAREQTMPSRHPSGIRHKKYRETADSTIVSVPDEVKHGYIIRRLRSNGLSRPRPPLETITFQRPIEIAVSRHRQLQPFPRTSAAAEPTN